MPELGLLDGPLQSASLELRLDRVQQVVASVDQFDLGLDPVDGLRCHGPPLWRRCSAEDAGGDRVPGQFGQGVAVAADEQRQVAPGPQVHHRRQGTAVGVEAGTGQQLRRRPAGVTVRQRQPGLRAAAVRSRRLEVPARVMAARTAAQRDAPAQQTQVGGVEVDGVQSLRAAGPYPCHLRQPLGRQRPVESARVGALGLLVNSGHTAPFAQVRRLQSWSGAGAGRPGWLCPGRPTPSVRTERSDEGWADARHHGDGDRPGGERRAVRPAAGQPVRPAGRPARAPRADRAGAAGVALPAPAGGALA